jgi:hypothetical protein
VGAVLGAVVAAVAGALVVGAPAAPPAPTITPVAADDAAEQVTVAGERVQPLDAAVARLSAVLAELGTRLREAPEAPEALSGPDASATSDRAPGRSRPAPTPGSDAAGSDDPEGEGTGTSEASGETEPAGSTADAVPPDGEGTGRSEEHEVRVDVPTRTDEVEDALDDPLGSTPAPDDDEAPASNLRLELPTLADDEGGHLSFRPATG